MADHIHNYTNTTNMAQNSSASTYSSTEMSFEVADYFEFSDWNEDGPGFTSLTGGYNNNDLQNQGYGSGEMSVDSAGIGGSGGGGYRERSTANRNSGREKKEAREKVAFKTKSEVEILDDGFKWRKYGKKMVKNSPNPRNYYKCSVEGCPVKKRVERDNEDARYVLTTYEGIHNHQGPMH